MSETLWQKAYDEYVQENSYQGKLEKENKRLKAKLNRIGQIIDTAKAYRPTLDSQDIQAICEVLEDE